MSQGPPTPPDPSELSPEVAQLTEQAVQAERAATEAERNVRQAAEAEAAEIKAYNEKLDHLVKEFERAKFGHSSEKLDPEQKELEAVHRVLRTTRDESYVMPCPRRCPSYISLGYTRLAS